MNGIRVNGMNGVLLTYWRDRAECVQRCDASEN